MRFAKYSLRDKEPRSIVNIDSSIDWNRLRVIKSMDIVSLYSKECLECNIASGCKSCPAENYDSADTNTIFQRSTAICKMHKAKVRAKNYYWIKLNRTISI